uniref:Aspartate beta-hydroxylase n=1 Tax=Calidris pygmaea TaxID=425635 RepID=A0A8C3K2P7_9CHAR
MADDTESKHGGSKNGKKEGLSGSSFFTWFMVIALLGVWTSVAVVWFELVDYEEVLAKAKDFRYNLSEVLQGKLGIYDADGDGDFDVEDAKVLLGLKERSVPAQPPSPDSEETIQAAEKPHVESEHKNADIELEEEVQSVLREALHSQPDADLLTDDLGAMESEPYEAPVSYDYDMDAEKTITDPEVPGDSELTLEDAIEHYAEDTGHEDYNEDHEPKHEKQTETQDTGIYL